MFCKTKSAKKKTFFLRGDFRPLSNKNVQILDHFFPQGFQISKNIGHPTLGSGCKNTVKWYLKKWTDTQTNTHMDISTYKKRRPRGPMLWKSWQIIRLSSFAICFLFSKLFGFLAAHISYKSLVVSWSVCWKTLGKEWHIKEYKNIKWYTYLTISGSDYWNHIWVKTSLCLHLLLGGWQH